MLNYFSLNLFSVPSRSSDQLLFRPSLFDDSGFIVAFFGNVDGFCARLNGGIAAVVSVGLSVENMLNHMLVSFLVRHPVVADVRAATPANHRPFLLINRFLVGIRFTVNNFDALRLRGVLNIFIFRFVVSFSGIIISSPDR